MTQQELELTKTRLNNFISGCEDSNGEEPPNDYTYQNISKIECARYATQQVETVKFFFRTKGKKGNNKPYTYLEEVPTGTYNMLCDWLYSVRTYKSNIGDIEQLFDKPKLKKKSNIENMFQDIEDR